MERASRSIRVTTNSCHQSDLGNAQAAPDLGLSPQNALNVTESAFDGLDGRERVLDPVVKRRRSADRTDRRNQKARSAAPSVKATIMQTIMSVPAHVSAKAYHIRRGMVAKFQTEALPLTR
jgi:hypothetical protein